MGKEEKTDNFSRNIYTFTKRLTDVFGGLIAMFFSLPLLIIVSLAVKLDSPGNVFFLQERVGKNGRYFTMFKFRTLFVEHFGLFTDQEEPHPYRVTRVGKYLRRYKLDEIPQFVNVIFGQMSLVGPRPDLPIHVEKYVYPQHDRLLVRPGLTGISQVSGNTKHSWHDRIIMDLWYVKNRSWLLDMKIMAYTLVTVVKGENLQTDPLNVHRLWSKKIATVSRNGV